MAADARGKNPFAGRQACLTLESVLRKKKTTRAATEKHQGTKSALITLIIYIYKVDFAVSTYQHL